jgi:hypothetical protein
LNDIEHSKTKVRHPQTNGSCEKLYTSIEEMQKDLDDNMNYYNNDRTNQGKRCQGRTPFETFLEGKVFYQKFVHEEGKEKKTPIRRWEPEVETEYLH